MNHHATDRVMLSDVATMVLRVLIGSYFVAVALEIIPGTDLSVLFATVLAAPLDKAVATWLVFLLSFMVMIGLHTRAAALLLALITVFSSYLAMVQTAGGADLASFWRDVALIAALILTYREPDPRHPHRVRVVRRHVQPRRLTPKVPAEIPRPVRPRRPGHALAARLSAARAEIARHDDIDNIFVDPPQGA